MRLKEQAHVAVVIVVAASASVNAAVVPLGTGFTYQGQLKQGGAPVDSPTDFVFQLFDAETNGIQVGASLIRNGVDVVNGLFTVELDFGIEVLDGSARWLQVSVSAVPLAPRQPITATPYALQTRGIVVNELGRVGLGTRNPANQLTVAGDADFSGNVGIGANVPTSMLHFQRPYASTAIRFQSVRFDQGAPTSLLRAPGAATTSGAGATWDAPGAALAPDDVWATSNLSEIVGTPDADQSRFLDLTAAGFALPAGAQVTGFTVQIEGHATAACSECEGGDVTLSVELLGGSGESTGKSIKLGASDTTTGTGGTFDPWGLTWAPEQVNDGAFGARISASLVLGDLLCLFGGCVRVPCDCTGTGTSFVDAVTITVHFFDAPTTSTPVDWSLGLSQDDANFRIAATPDLSAPAFVITPQGSVGIGTTEFLGGFFKLAVNGAAAKPSGGQWSALSDARLKRNIEPLHGALERMLSLRGVTFEFTEEGLRTGLALPGRHVGLIAQEVEPVFPEWVSESSSGYKFVTETGTTALLVEALRELRAEKDAQVAEKDGEIAELNNRLVRLEAMVARMSAERDEEKP